MPAARRTLLILGFCLTLPPAAGAQEPVDYLKQIKPILSRNCVECHNGKKARGDLRLDTAAELLRGGKHGQAIVPGSADKSLLIQALHGEAKLPRMPYKRAPLGKGEIQLIAAWIDQGARAPAQETAGAINHWAFTSPVRAKLPPVQDQPWPRNAVDHFILARLEKEGIAPSPEADKVVLLRRVYLDLIGLPPTLGEVDAFLGDASPNAYDKVVERLLNSPHYGEKWGRHWLDLARYADSHGYTIDAPREIWKYRDWVIDAFNGDMPFDQFVIEQMAGDLLPGATLAQKIATGFHRNTLINQEGGIDTEQFRVEAVADRVSTTGTVFLGLTLGCARCHNHKFDPLTQKEYFQLFAFLNNQAEPTLDLADPAVSAKRKQIQAKMDRLEEDLDVRLKEIFPKLSGGPGDKAADNIAMILNLRPDQRTEKHKRTLAQFFQDKDAGLKKSFAELEVLKKQLPKFPTTLVLQELAKPRTTHIHIQGDFSRKGAKVEPGVPSVLHPLAAVAAKSPNRLDLAHWLVDRKNPLLARVALNRLWQHYFGKGIVETENDFGTQGSSPTHPELLDWLAVEFMDRGWSLKHMHRLIVTSAAYRQSSKVRPELAKLDPYNKLLARQTRLRLDAELVRDSALAVSGLLSDKVGGPSVHPPQPKGVYAFTQVTYPWTVSTGADRYRRGLYTFLQRSVPYPALIVFDAPDGTSACTRRVRSNTPLQALTLLNDKSYLELAHGLAYRVLKDGPADARARLELAFRTALLRQPAAWELHKLEQFLEQQLAQYDAAPKSAKNLLKAEPGAGIDLLKCDLAADVSMSQRAAWVAVTRVLLNLDEFITRE